MSMKINSIGLDLTQVRSFDRERLSPRAENVSLKQILPGGQEETTDKNKEGVSDIVYSSGES